MAGEVPSKLSQGELSFTPLRKFIIFTKKEPFFQKDISSELAIDFLADNMFVLPGSSFFLQGW